MNTPMTKKLALAKAYDFCATRIPKLTVVFIHGIASDSSSFAHALKYLENQKALRDVRFVAFDLLGSGKSPKNDELEYSYEEQIAALHNALDELKPNIPIVLVGHSMGALIATRYASIHKNSVEHLILVSPPVYTKEDLAHPEFEKGVKIFREAVSLKHRQALEEESFDKSMKNIVLDKNNYDVLADIKIPTTIIYGDLDKFISSYNLPKLLAENPRYFTIVKTVGHHSVSREKYVEIAKVLEEIVND